LNEALNRTRDFPLEFYVSTSYADGSPASCEVAISQVSKADDTRRERALPAIKTNRYGIAKVQTTALPKETDDSDSEVSLMFRARDGKGAGGQHTETSAFTTDRYSVSRPTNLSTGMASRFAPRSRPANPTWSLPFDATDREKVLQSQLVHLQNGRASLTIPYARTFKRRVTVAAYLPAPNGENDITSASRTILYPHDRDLKFTLALDQESYRPGGEANANFLTRTATGRVAESALGIVIFDKASKNVPARIASSAAHTVSIVCTAI